MVLEFIIPLHHEDLEIKNSNQYCVKPTDLDLQDESSVARTVEACIEQLAQDPTHIIEQDIFDPLFNLVRFFENLREEHKVDLVESISSAVSALLPSIADLVKEDDAFVVAERSPTLRNAFKMSLFLLSWVLQIVEKASAHKAITAAAMHNPKGAKKKRAAANTWNWEERQREKVTYAIRDSLEVDFGKLWKQSMVEEDFITLYFRCGYRLLETPSIVKAEFRGLRRTAFGLVALPLHRYGQTMMSSVSTALIHMCTKYEHCPPAVGELVATAYTDYKISALGTEIVQEIGKMDPDSLARDLGGCRNLSTLLCEAAKRAPKLVHPELAVLMPHFNADNYPMRSALSQVVGHLIIAGMASARAQSKLDNEALHDQNQDQQQQEQAQEEGEDATDKSEGDTFKMDSTNRENLLELLAERVRDKNALCRAKVMQTWILLTQERAVPLTFLPILTDVAVSRLKDKSSIVRKYAVQLTSMLLECNPFSATLQLSECEKKLAELETELNGDISLKEEAPEDVEQDEENGAEVEEEQQENETENEEEAAEEEEEAAEEENKSTPIVAETTTAEDATKAVLQKKVDFYTAAVSFIESVHRAMETIMELLDSKTLSDVSEAISLVVMADAFKVEKARDGVRKMMLLVWSKDPAIKESVITAYKTLFIVRPCEGVPRQHRATAVANSLIGLTLGANLGEITSLDEIVAELVTQDVIKDAAIAALWNTFGSESSHASLGALMILSMAANSKPKVIEGNLSKLIAVGFKNLTNATAMDLAKQTCMALQKLQPTGVELSPSHQLFDHLRSILLVDDAKVTGSRKAFDNSWFSAAEQALNTAFDLCTQPEDFCTNIIRMLSAEPRMWKNAGKSLSKRGLSRLLFVVGHVAVKHFVFIETIASKIRKQEEKKEKAQTMKLDTGAPGSPRGVAAEMGISAAIDDGEVEAIREMAEVEILGRQNLIGICSTLITSLCGLAYAKSSSVEDGEAKTVAKSLDGGVRESAVLGLCKLMCVGQEFCEPNLQLLFTILNKDPSARVRANIIICLGDLSFRYPNMLEPWCPHFFARLNDRDLTVRKHTLMALTHLILNDMIKVRAQVSDIAMCLEDAAPRMQDLARMFFFELAHKGTNNPIYNYLPDIIGRLSHNIDVSPQKFQRIVKFLMSFIEKDKQAEGLVEKLCHRFRGTTETTQWRDIAHCLSLLSFSDRAMKKLSDLYKCYSDKLGDEQIYESFTMCVHTPLLLTC